MVNNKLSVHASWHGNGDANGTAGYPSKLMPSSYLLFAGLKKKKR
ncbi:hypothetical protein SLEP1_g58419 [Rubroshorea leprosula]|nr:hypothetical protein SLEP1_g58419 [Rubroshorea leprosula]